MEYPAIYSQASSLHVPDLAYESLPELSAKTHFFHSSASRSLSIHAETLLNCFDLFHTFFKGISAIKLNHPSTCGILFALVPCLVHNNVIILLMTLF